MTRVASTIPNIINGVSQQAPALRLPSQFEEVVNMFPLPSRGLVRRPPAQFVAHIGAEVPEGAFSYFINRDTQERYQVLIYGGDLKVYDLMTGVEKTVAFPDGKAYLSSVSAIDEFAATTISDYTFITNKKRIVNKNGIVTTPGRPKEAMVYVKQGAYSRTYRVTIDGAVAASYTTPDGSTSAHTIATSTDVIAEFLQTGSSGSTTDGSFGGTALNAMAGMICTRRGSVLYLRRADGADFNVAIEDGASGTAMVSYKGTAQRLSDLPASNAPTDFVLAITGDASSSYDDYYVQWQDAGGSEGVWKEVAQPGSLCQFDLSSMPHILVREADGTFTFRRADWVKRQVGDDTSAPWPSFVGQAVTDVFFHRNRLGFYAGENQVLTRAGAFFDFWPTTVTQQLDDDPIDVAASSTQVTPLLYAVPHQRKLFAFSAQKQFVMSAPDILTPSTAAISPTTAYDVSPLVRPVSVGKFIYFAVERGAATGILEYNVDNFNEEEDAVDVTGHVPQFIPTGARVITASPNENTLAVYSTAKPDSLYLYRNFRVGEQLLQSAWFRWDFGTNTSIRSVSFIGTELYALVNRNGFAMILKIDIAQGALDPDERHGVHLDGRYKTSSLTAPVYEAPSLSFPQGRTHWTLAYPHAPDESPAVYAIKEHQQLTDMYGVVATSGTGVIIGTKVFLYRNADNISVYAPGDWTGEDLFIGFATPQGRVTMSTIFLREKSQGGGTAVVGGGRLQLWKVGMHHEDTSAYKVKVKHERRPEVTRSFVARRVSQTILGSPLDTETGFKAFTAKGENVRLSITFETLEHHPANFTAIEWRGDYTNDTRRL